MLRRNLEDGAIAAAKASSHAEVAPAHVFHAIARHFRDRPEVEALLAATREALGPPGTASTVPVVGTDARALLDSITTEEDAVAALLAAGPKPLAPAAGAAPGASQASAETIAAEPASADGGAPPEPESVSDILVELDALVGLAPVKAQVKSIIAVVQANQERVKAGLVAVNPGLHLVFTGPPGTGKTTVARLIARLYAATGALPGSGFTEVSRVDLIAAYVGQTAIKTNDVIQRTRPGVLFIDEAYALAPTHQSDFGAEAIATLVKAMEDHRDTLAVIAAGYADEMAEFIASNPGLRSRFKTFIHFPDYGAEELTRIFEGFGRQAGIAMPPEALEKAAEVFEAQRDRPGFGNARFARSLFEHAYARMAARAAADSKVTVDELSAIAAEDLDWKDDDLNREIRRIGFDPERR